MKKHLNVRTMGLVSCVLALLCMWGCKEKVGPCGENDERFMPFFSVKYIAPNGWNLVDYLLPLGYSVSENQEDLFEMRLIRKGTQRVITTRSEILEQADLFPRNPNFKNEKWYSYDIEVVDTFVVDFLKICEGQKDSLFLKFIPRIDECDESKLRFEYTSLTYRSNHKDTLLKNEIPGASDYLAYPILPCNLD